VVRSKKGDIFAVMT